MDINLQELTQISGEGLVRRFRYIVPVLKFNGSTGKWSLLLPQQNKQWDSQDIPKNDIELAILKVRRQYTSYKKIQDGFVRLYTTEHDSPNEQVALFEFQKGNTRPEMIDSGFTKDLKSRHPELAFRQILYCLFNQQVVKFAVKGKSLTSLFNYYKSFAENEHMFQYFTKVSKHEETNEGGLSFWAMDFEKNGAADMPTIAEKMKEVQSNLEAQEAFGQDFSKEERVGGFSEPHTSTEDVIQVEGLPA